MTLLLRAVLALMVLVWSTPQAAAVAFHEGVTSWRELEEAGVLDGECP
jgi:hypothetical protein